MVTLSRPESVSSEPDLDLFLPILPKVSFDPNLRAAITLGMDTYKSFIYCLLVNRASLCSSGWTGLWTQRSASAWIKGVECHRCRILFNGKGLTRQWSNCCYTHLIDSKMHLTGSSLSNRLVLPVYCLHLLLHTSLPVVSVHMLFSRYAKLILSLGSWNVPF